MGFEHLVAAACLAFAGCAAGSGRGTADASSEGQRDVASVEDVEQSGPERPPSLPSAEVIASRLSLFIWDQREPTLELFRQAGSVTTTAQLESLARSMVLDAKADAGIRAFIRQLLRLDGLIDQPQTDPVLTAALRESMRAEPADLAVAVVRGGGDSFERLFLADFTVVDQVLAAHYGAPLVNGVKGRIPFAPGERVGLLGTAGALARYGGSTHTTWPPRRHWLLTDTLLCENEWNFRSPPGSTVSLEVDRQLPLREQTIAVTSGETCLFCHPVVNALGFAFIRFDPLGRYRTADGHGVLDPRGEVPATYDGPGMSFDGQPDLMRRLMERPSARRCFSRRWLTYGLGLFLPGQVPQDRKFTSSLDQVQRRFEESGRRLTELMVAITLSERFLAED